MTATGSSSPIGRARGGHLVRNVGSPRAVGAVGRPQPDVGELHVALVEDEAADRHVASHDGLAGEAELWTEPQLVGDGPLPGVALGARLPALDDHDAARRALARPPQAWVKGIPARSAAGRIGSPGRHSTSR